MLKPKHLLAASAVVSALVAGVAIAASPALTGLGLGRWQLHEIGTASPARGVCVRDPLQLIQLNHPGIACTRYAIDESADHVTIQYTCPGKGYGRTTVTVESADLIKLDTQGIGPDGQPFDFVYEGRRTGACGPQRR